MRMCKALMFRLLWFNSTRCTQDVRKVILSQLWFGKDFQNLKWLAWHCHDARLFDLYDLNNKKKYTVCYELSWIELSQKMTQQSLEWESLENWAVLLFIHVFDTSVHFFRKTLYAKYISVIVLRGKRHNQGLIVKKIYNSTAATL